VEETKIEKEEGFWEGF